MAKGHRGETCAQVIHKVLAPGDVKSFSELVRGIKEHGDWQDETIWQHLMGLVVNLPPERLHWKSAQPFLFLRGDGRYEIYDSNVHPKTIE